MKLSSNKSSDHTSYFIVIMYACIPQRHYIRLLLK